MKKVTVPDYQDMLKIFFSNTEKPVFVLYNMPEVLKGALFSRYSRSALPLRELFIKDYLNSEENKEIKKSIKDIQSIKQFQNMLNTDKAKSFYRKWLAMFGDDSIAELASIHMGIEEISVLAVKFIEERRVGISPLEKSTRYVRFDDKENGEYKYYKDPNILSSKYAQTYKLAMELLFDTYANLIAPMSEYFRKKFPKPEEVSDTAYETSIKAKALDTIRGLLPLATKTNMGILANGRAIEYLVTKMYAHPLKEVQDYAKLIHNEAKGVIENFVERVESEKGIEHINYLRKFQSETAKLVKELTDKETKKTEYINRYVKLIEYDLEGDMKITANILYENTNLTPKVIQNIVKKMSKKQKTEVIETYVNERKGKWHKVGKAFENIYYTFDIVADFGAYKDLQRHRIISLHRQPFTTELGYEIPADIKEAGLEHQYEKAMETAHKAYMKIKERFPYEAQYLVTHGHFVRWKIKMNLREAFHLCELRSSPQGHPSYRKIAQEMYKLIKEVNPIVGNTMKFVNMQDPGLERLSAEVRKEEKLNALAKKV